MDIFNITCPDAVVVHLGHRFLLLFVCFKMVIISRYLCASTQYVAVENCSYVLTCLEMYVFCTQFQLFFFQRILVKVSLKNRT